ncbi:nucleotidyltransferase [Lentibacillus sp. Marseille-P4043]|uniref:nucleotidyltransferase n=1 Tax=Lentibacillus sp. Marseille-P4043 TaxID=2040293 RepID=UPI000D0B5E58|nr:nucleotidyltransferase [Lentibacillus sp. Marseille-P4043]
MKACGLIVEYNPFHNGHVYHLEEAKKVSKADCMITVMSGSFLQRGEPAIIDKFHRTNAALASGIDIVVELPYVFAVQSSDLFAKGSILTLHALGIDSICFGSESGMISDFVTGYHTFYERKDLFRETLKEQLNQGMAYPEASRLAYQKIGLTTAGMDLAKPNNILGFSYVKAILENSLPIEPLTIKRSKSGYHDETITSSIASATSIRKQLFTSGKITPEIAETIPKATKEELERYYHTASCWHHWEAYFNLLHYRVMTMSKTELRAIQGVDEGLEYRIKKTAKTATSFTEWVKAIKTKRYTWTRLQRMFVHILTNTKKQDMDRLTNLSSIPYVRILGLTETGRAYLNKAKKQTDVPLISNLSRTNPPMLSLEEKATAAYYSILPPTIRQQLRRQELQPPIMI